MYWEQKESEYCRNKPINRCFYFCTLIVTSHSSYLKVCHPPSIQIPTQDDTVCDLHPILKTVFHRNLQWPVPAVFMFNSQLPMITAVDRARSLADSPLLISNYAEKRQRGNSDAQENMVPTCFSIEPSCVRAGKGCCGSPGSTAPLGFDSPMPPRCWALAPHCSIWFHLLSRGGK